MQEVLSPKPCALINDDGFVIHVDFVPVTKTDDCSTALAMIVVLYSIFEIQFGSHNLAIRLLYGILIQELDALDKRLRGLLSDWNFPVQKNRQVMVQPSYQVSTQLCLSRPRSEQIIDSLSQPKPTATEKVQ
jgi:hypothetical protein